MSQGERNQKLCNSETFRKAKRAVDSGAGREVYEPLFEKFLPSLSPEIVDKAKAKLQQIFEVIEKERTTSDAANENRHDIKFEAFKEWLKEVAEEVDAPVKSDLN